MENVSNYVRAPANDINDGLLEMVRNGQVIAFRQHGKIVFCAASNARPEYLAARVDYETVERHVRQQEETAMAVWN